VSLFKLGKLIGIAEKWVDLVEFVSSEWLRERGCVRGTFAEFWFDDNPEDMKLGIFLDESLLAQDKMITLAHELGHAKNFIVDFKRDGEHWKFLDSSPSASVLLERYAWLYSVDFLKMVDFEDWDEFLKAVDFSLKTYHDNRCNIQSKEEFWKQLEDRIGNPVPLRRFNYAETQG
jgi:hypothetical protein